MDKEMKERLDYKIQTTDLDELKAWQRREKGALESLRGKARIVSMAMSNRMANKRQTISALSTAIHVREHGISKQTLPSLGDEVTIQGTFKGRDFERTATVTSVGETIFGTNDGWKFYARHDGWIHAGSSGELKAIL